MTSETLSVLMAVAMPEAVTVSVTKPMPMSVAEAMPVPVTVSVAKAPAVTEAAAVAEPTISKPKPAFAEATFAEATLPVTVAVLVTAMKRELVAGVGSLRLERQAGRISDHRPPHARRISGDGSRQHRNCSAGDYDHRHTQHCESYEHRKALIGSDLLDRGSRSAVSRLPFVPRQHIRAGFEALHPNGPFPRISSPVGTGSVGHTPGLSVNLTGSASCPAVPHMPGDLRSSIHDLKSSHTADAVARRLAGPSRDSYLRDFVYGAIDGAVTTFAVVSGVAGADLAGSIVLILGAANLVGDGFSMAASNFLGTRAERQQLDHARQIEEREIELYPEGEREEVRQILAAKGFEGDLLERAVEVMTADRARWVNLMLQEELGLSLGGSEPLKAAGTTFVAFIVVGLIPLLPFIAQEIGLIGEERVFAASAVLTGVAFFGVGAAKARFVERNALLSGLETLAVGGAAAGLAYVVGLALKSIL